METVVLGWYVMVNTGSVLWLTVFGSLQFLGTLAAPVFGVLGDRLGARVMLCAMRATYAALATSLMLLAVSGRLTPTWVLVVATLAGIVRPNDLVMRNTLIGETMGPDRLVAALGLSRATTDSARVAGALAGAGLSTVLGLGVTYAFVTSFYTASLGLTFGISRRLPVPDPAGARRPDGAAPSVPLVPDHAGARRSALAAAGVRRGPDQPPALRQHPTVTWWPRRLDLTGTRRSSPAAARVAQVSDPTGTRHSSSDAGGAARPSGWRELQDGLAHVAATPALLAFMWLAFLINLTAYPVSNGLLPYVAKRVYLVDATGLGLLVASFSFGGLLASTIVVVSGGSRHPERATLVCTAIWYAVLLGFGHVRSLGGGIVLLVVAGFAQNVAMIAMTVTLLAAAGDRFRGRVMGVRMLAVYGLPVGLMAAGALIERVGYPLTITAYAAVGLLFTVLIGARWRASLWRRPQPAESTSLP